MAINYKQCPQCGSKNAINIEYGYPSLDMIKEESAGEIWLGGCCTTANDPEYYCKDCEYEWNRDQAIDATYSKIKAIKASVGGYFGGYYDVYIDLITRKVTWLHGGCGQIGLPIHKTIRTATATRFVDGLKMVNLLDWKANYIEPSVCDGTQWSVEIIRDGRNIKKNGDNKFPDEWDMFCSLISQVLGREFR